MPAAFATFNAAGPAGLFDIRFDFDTSNADSGTSWFHGGETLVNDVIGSAITASTFNLFSVANDPNDRAGVLGPSDC